jgi:hypothetical protein
LPKTAAELRDEEMNDPLEDRGKWIELPFEFLQVCGSAYFSDLPLRL